jgi:hypothetical protein
MLSRFSLLILEESEVHHIDVAAVQHLSSLSNTTGTAGLHVSFSQREPRKVNILLCLLAPRAVWALAGPSFYSLCAAS